MARKRYTAEEIISQLRTVEIELGKGLAVVDACRKLGITEQSSGMTFSMENVFIPYWRRRS
jgi:hypothetical protein